MSVRKILITGIAGSTGRAVWRRLVERKSARLWGIDVRNWASGDLRRNEKEIAEKVSFAKTGGGYIFHSDHSIPDDVSFPTYERVVALAREHGRYG